MTPHTLIGDWRTWLVASNLSKNTIRLRCYQLRRFAEEHPDLLAVTTADLVAWLGRPGWDQETRRSQRSALRGFYQWAHAAGLVDADPSGTLPRIKQSGKRRAPAPQWAVEAGLKAEDDRVPLMVLLGYRQGLRAGEIAQVNTETDLIEDLNGWSLVVHGKGGKDRIMPLHPEVAAAILARPRGWLFPGQTDGHLSSGHVTVLVSRALPGKWTAHPLRHRFGTDAWARTHNLLGVMELLGHATPETTARYVHQDSDVLRQIVEAAAA
ncbi:site-specific recombinase XerD [Propionicimonas paludicola]|uniref:Site-specific recombinase XerD n=1 Tax=Propionicimonas paludicola TaxID=185243 RepID=A0A2A9CRM5_9ACTN|nr:tyrosine-type recombinase/integrase [Propionicimonas paludicola]PFG16262.1 site-specific recombinase XerD [Propionicimonas paludicola]